MKIKILALILLILFSFLFAQEKQQKTQLILKNEWDIVYKDEMTGEFHIFGCEKLGKSRTGMMLRYALEKGYKPCSKCFPESLYISTPSPSGEITQEAKSSDEITQGAKKYIDLGPIKIEPIKTGAMGDYSEIKIKITNKSGKDIDSCELTCVLLKDDKEIDAETNYVISSTEGGLKNGDFLYFEYMFRTSYGEWNKFAFKIKTIEYK